MSYTDNLIPYMTSNTSPSGLAASTETWTEREAWMAFRDPGAYAVPENGFVSSTDTATSCWLSYAFNKKYKICKYEIGPKFFSYDTNEAPKDWTFEAWDGPNSTWVVLDTRTDEIDWDTDWEIRSYTFANTVAYSKYRINITDNNGGDKTRIHYFGMMALEEQIIQIANETVNVEIQQDKIQVSQININTEIRVPWVQIPQVAIQVEVLLPNPISRLKMWSAPHSNWRGHLLKKWGSVSETSTPTWITYPTKFFEKPDWED